MHSVSLANIPFLLLAIVAIYGCYAIRALRWQRMSRYIGACSFWETYSATLMGFASIFLFARVGEPVRPLLLAQKGNTPVAGMFGIWVLERAFDFAADSYYSASACWFFPTAFSIRRQRRMGGKASTGGWLLVVLLERANLRSGLFSFTWCGHVSSSTGRLARRARLAKICSRRHRRIQRRPASHPHNSRFAHGDFLYRCALGTRRRLLT